MFEPIRYTRHEYTGSAYPDSSIRDTGMKRETDSFVLNHSTLRETEGMPSRPPSAPATPHHCHSHLLPLLPLLPPSSSPPPTCFNWLVKDWRTLQSYADTVDDAFQLQYGLANTTQRYMAKWALSEVLGLMHRFLQVGASVGGAQGFTCILIGL